MYQLHVFAGKTILLTPNKNWPPFLLDWINSLLLDTHFAVFR